MVQSSQPLIEKYLDILQLHSKNIKIVLLFSTPSPQIRRLWQPTFLRSGTKKGRESILPPFFSNSFILPYNLLSCSTIFLTKTIVLALMKTRSRSVSAIMTLRPRCNAIQLKLTTGTRLHRTNTRRVSFLKQVRPIPVIVERIIPFNLFNYISFLMLKFVTKLG